MIATKRPVEGLFADASGFGTKDRTYILAVAALERDVDQAAAILLSGRDQDADEVVAGTFARQRLTSDIAQLIGSIRPYDWQTEEDQKNATSLIETILSEFARGTHEFADGGRQTFDIALVYVHLIGAGCDAEADKLLTKVFVEPWRAGLAVELDEEFDHYVPGNDVVGDWAGKRLSPSAVQVMAELLTTARPSRRRQARIDDIVDNWRPKSAVKLCDELEKRGQARDAAMIRERVVSRPDLGQVAEAVAVWWGRLPGARSRELLLDAAVQGRGGPRSVVEIRSLAERLENDELLPKAAGDKLRKHALVDGCAGDDLTELLFSIAAKQRPDAAEKFARRMAVAAKDRQVKTRSVVCYIRSLRQARSQKGSQTAANLMINELVGDARMARVVAPVGAVLLRDEATEKDGRSILQRYLNRHNAISDKDVVSVFRFLAVMGMLDAEFVQGLAGATVGRWPATRRREAAFALRDAGMLDLAREVLPRL
ncbi:hypothetical protein [Catenulispora sp. EB89]|uniref:hypothetical protein n=1 Tax=Catenulispora sp. EB89 TaxID=3156257 RepID=UPI003510F067